MPKRQKSFESYFSPAERAYTDYLHANKGSVLGVSPSQQVVQGSMGVARPRPKPEHRVLAMPTSRDLDHLQLNPHLRSAFEFVFGPAEEFLKPDQMIDLPARTWNFSTVPRSTRNEIVDEETVGRDDASPVARVLWPQSSPAPVKSTVQDLQRRSEAASGNRSDPQPFKSGDSAFESPGARAKPKDDPDERARQRAAENSGRFADYNGGDIAKTVDAVIDSSTWFDRRIGNAGKGVNGKGRYIWTKYGWVDLQHVIGAATTTIDPVLNELLGLGKETEQYIEGMKSAFKREDLLSNHIGASALAYQQRFGGTIGQAIAHVLAWYRPVTRQQATEFLGKGGQADSWPW